MQEKRKEHILVQAHLVGKFSPYMAKLPQAGEEGSMDENGVKILNKGAGLFKILIFARSQIKFISSCFPRPPCLFFPFSHYLLGTHCARHVSCRGGQTFLKTMDFMDSVVVCLHF